MRRPVAFAGKPDETEVAARGPVRDIALIEHRHLGTGARCAIGDGCADHTASDDDHLELPPNRRSSP